MSDFNAEMRIDAALDYLALCRQYPDATEKVPITFVPTDEGGHWVADLPTGERVEASGLLSLASTTLPRGYMLDLADAGMMLNGERLRWR